MNMPNPKRLSLNFQTRKNHGTLMILQFGQLFDQRKVLQGSVAEKPGEHMRKR
jgi:hypothetical protein